MKTELFCLGVTILYRVPPLIRQGFALPPSPEGRRLLPVAEVLHEKIAVPPVFLNLDPGGEVDFCTHKLFAVLPGQRRDLFQHLALLADNNALVAGLLAVNGGIQVDDAIVSLGELGDLHSGAVGNLLVQAPQQLFPDDLCHDLPLRLIGCHILREQEGAFLGVLAAHGKQFLYPVSGFGGDGHNGLKIRRLGVFGDDLQQGVLLHGIDLVDDQNGRAAACLNFFNQALLLRANGGNGLYHQQRQVHIRNRFLSYVHHIVAQLGSGPVEARGVDEDVLGVALGDDAADAVSGGLGLIGNDGDFFTYQVVRQCGLTHIGPSADGDHSGFCLHSLSFISPGSCPEFPMQWPLLWRASAASEGLRPGGHSPEDAAWSGWSGSPPPGGWCGRIPWPGRLPVPGRCTYPPGAPSRCPDLRIPSSPRAALRAPAQTWGSSAHPWRCQCFGRCG